MNSFYDVGLFTIIRDFFVRYVFGGMTSTGEIYSNTFGLGWFYTSDNVLDDGTAFSGNDIFIAEYPSMNDLVIRIGFSDWLSTTATFITLVGLFIAITLLIISLFKWIVRLVSLRG